MTSATGSEPWYVAEGRRGQQLLEEGRVAEATALFEAVLAGVGDAPSYGRAVILERLGRSLQLGGSSEPAIGRLREALAVAGSLAPSRSVKALRAAVRSELGDALRDAGRRGEARKAYQAALEIAEELRDPRSQAIEQQRLGALAVAEGDPGEALARYRASLALLRPLREPAAEAAALHELGRVLHALRRWDEADRHYREAARIREERGDLAGAEQSWTGLAALHRDAGSPEAAEEPCRKAIEAARRLGDPARLVRGLRALAELLRPQPARLVEARRLAEEALAVSRALDPRAAEAWAPYGTLAEMDEAEAAASADEARGAGLRARALAYSELVRRGPQILAAADRVGEAPSRGRAVILGRVGRCLCAAGREEAGVTRLREAVSVAEGLPPSDDAPALRPMLWTELGDGLRVAGRGGEAAAAYQAALRAAEASGDLNGRALALARLSALGLPEPAAGDEADGWPQEAPGEGAAFAIWLRDDVDTDYAFEPDLLVDGPRERRIMRPSGESEPLAGDVRPLPAPGVQTWVDEQGRPHFRLPAGEPAVERDSGCTVVRRTRREVVVDGDAGLVWRLLHAADGTAPAAAIVRDVPPAEQATAARLLAALAAAGVLDVSGRAFGRFLHRATKKGVLPAGGLESEEVLRLATDGSYRAYPGAPRVALGEEVPDRLRAFHALTRARRSSRDFRGAALRREELGALLHTACGVTGSLTWEGREVRLRAYPSSGALYAVGIYPVTFRVEGLAPAVYHYRAPENVLEVVRPAVDPGRIAGAALPVEREMVAGAAVMICLTGSFPRHERKYGEGGYRMLVAEAGHVSQNLILAATALGASARPFGGVFDDLLNQELGLEGDEEQFLLAVLVGHPGRNAPSGSAG